MGLFNKFKEIFKKEDKKDIELYDKGLEKTRKEFVSNLSFLGHKYTKVNDEYFDELESILIKADIGVNTTYKFLDKLKKRVKEEKIEDASVLREIIIDELFMIYVDGDSLTDKINIQKEGPTVILMVGVNGVGKTTTIGKLANIYHNQGHKVMLIGADTFRAGAVPQLEEWAKRTNSCFCGKEIVDPSSVIYDGLEKALKENCDLILIDTAGRLQNKTNLMKELEKIISLIVLSYQNNVDKKLTIGDEMEDSKELIIKYFFIKHLKVKEIAEIVHTSSSYITKIVKQDKRYSKEKEYRSNKSKEKRKQDQNRFIKHKREQKRIDDNFAFVEEQHRQASLELSKSKHLSNESYRKWNISAYKYNPSKHRYEFDENLGRSADIPKYIKER